MVNKSIKEWHTFNLPLYLKYLQHKLILTAMSKQTKVKEAASTLSTIPNSKLTIQSNVTSTGVKYILTGLYDGLILTKDKKEELKRYIGVVIEVYGLVLEDIATIEGVGYTTNLKLIII